MNQGETASLTIGIVGILIAILVAFNVAGCIVRCIRNVGLSLLSVPSGSATASTYQVWVASTKTQPCARASVTTCDVSRRAYIWHGGLLADGVGASLCSPLDGTETLTISLEGLFWCWELRSGVWLSVWIEGYLLGYTRWVIQGSLLSLHGWNWSVRTQLAHLLCPL